MRVEQGGVAHEGLDVGAVSFRATGAMRLLGQSHGLCASSRAVLPAVQVAHRVSARLYNATASFACPSGRYKPSCWSGHPAQGRERIAIPSNRQRLVGEPPVFHGPITISKRLAHQAPFPSS